MVRSRSPLLAIYTAAEHRAIYCYRSESVLMRTTGLDEIGSSIVRKRVSLGCVRSTIEKPNKTPKGGIDGVLAKKKTLYVVCQGLLYGWRRGHAVNHFGARNCVRVTHVRAHL